MEIIWENDILYLTQEASEVPWIKIFLKSEKKELSDCNKEELDWLFRSALCVEQAMREYYSPAKINHASFGNMLPKVHWHVQARFENDSYFPESLWGKQMRESTLCLPEFKNFADLVQKKMNNE